MALIVAVMEPLHSIDPLVPTAFDVVLPSTGSPYANSWCIKCAPPARTPPGH